MAAKLALVFEKITDLAVIQLLFPNKRFGDAYLALIQLLMSNEQFLVEFKRFTIASLEVIQLLLAKFVYFVI